MVILLLVCFFTWKIASRFVFMVTIPWGVITILLLPIANSIALFHKLSETRKNVAEDITNAESRKLLIIVSRKRNAAITSLILQIIVIAFVAILSLAGTPEPLKEYGKIISNITVTMVVASLYSIIPSVIGIMEVYDFEAIIKERKRQKKKIKNAVTKLK